MEVEEFFILSAGFDGPSLLGPLTKEQLTNEIEGEYLFEGYEFPESIDTGKAGFLSMEYFPPKTAYVFRGPIVKVRPKEVVTKVEFK